MSDIQEIDEIIPRGSQASAISSHIETVTSQYAPPSASLPASATTPVEAAPSSPHRSKTASSAPRKGIMGLLATIGAILAKWWGVALGLLLKLKGLLIALKFLTIGKLFLTGGSMLLSIFVWSFVFGWPMAVGIVLSIFLHECGHALAAKKLGRKVGFMVFIPFCGAVVTTSRGRNAVEDAFVGIMGPVMGAVTGIACVGMFFATGSLFWLALAAFIFLMNLFNLAPTAPLDGGWIAPLFSPKILAPGLAVLLLLFWRNPMVWVLAFLSLPRIINAWKHGHEMDFYKATVRDRLKYGLAYVGLVGFLAASQLACFGYLNSHMPHRVANHSNRRV